jgi:hypothetical protein
MHPLRKLREAGKPTLAQITELLAENIVFNSPILARPIQGRELIALKLFRDAMYAALKDKLPPDVWDYPTQ